MDNDNPVDKKIVQGIESLGAFLSFVVAPIMWGYRLLQWLQSGEWPPALKVRNVLPAEYYFNVLEMENWIGIQKVILWFFNADLTFSIFFLGVLLFLYPMVLAD